MNHQQLKQYLLSLPEVVVDYPFDEDLAVYKVGSDAASATAKMFALVKEGSQPVQISLKSDPQLAVALRQKYDEVQPGVNLNKKHWNTIVCSGQMTNDEVFDLVRHSYQLVGAE